MQTNYSVHNGFTVGKSRAIGVERRLAGLMLAMIGLATPSFAQFELGGFDTPEGYTVVLNAPGTTNTIGGCGFFTPADRSTLFVDCDVDGPPPDTIYFWEDPQDPAPMGSFPFGDGTGIISDPPARYLAAFVHRPGVCPGRVWHHDPG